MRQAMGLFTTRVQPILMNACARCRCRDCPRRLQAGSGFWRHTGERTRHQAVNLVAAVAQIDREHPLASPLLVKAISLDGPGDRPPIKDRKTQAYQLLENWVRVELATSAADLLAGDNVAPGGAYVPNDRVPVQADALPAVPLPATPAPGPAPAANTGDDHVAAFAGDRKDDAHDACARPSGPVRSRPIQSDRTPRGPGHGQN